MAQVTRKLPSGQEPTQDMRSSVAHEALQRLITQAALDQELQRLRIVAPDAGGAPGGVRHAGVPRPQRASSTSRPSRRCCATTA